MSKLLVILNQLLALFHEFLKRHQNEQKQKDVEAANENPADWFNDHFNDDTNSMRNADNTDSPCKTEDRSD